MNTTADPISGVAEDSLFQSERYGSYAYEVPVTSGAYTVRLHLAELYWEGAGERTFDLLVEGQVELEEIDLFSQAGHDGAFNHVVEEVVVNDGTLNIELEGKQDAGTLSGFAVYSADGQLDTSVPEPSCKGYVGITYDDGPVTNTSTLVNLLKEHNLTPVTWFVWGERIGGSTAIIEQMMSVGEVQNHSFTHPDLTTLSYQQVYDQLERTSQALQDAGAPAPTLYRPPYGTQNATTQRAAADLGLRAIIWDVDSADWNSASTASIVNAARDLQDGQIMLMHDGYNTTNDAVAQIAADLEARGLCPGRIDPASGRAVAP